MTTDENEMQARVAMARAFAAAFVSRAHATGVKGKRRDDMALEAFIGAANWAEAMGDNKAAGYLTKLAWLCSIRGYAWVSEFAAGK